MRLLIHVMACLVFSSFSAAYANSVVNSPPEKNTDKNEKSVIERIPNRTLSVTIDSSQKNLKVNLTGEHAKFDWIIFQPKGEVISRLTTTSKIDKIMIDKLEKGTYVLMIKDDSGRVLVTAFDKI